MYTKYFIKLIIGINMQYQRTNTQRKVNNR